MDSPLVGELTPFSILGSSLSSFRIKNGNYSPNSFSTLPFYFCKKKKKSV
jgi:hypothetical protein